MKHLVKVVVYIADVRHQEAVYRTVGEYNQARNGALERAFRLAGARQANGRSSQIRSKRYGSNQNAKVPTIGRHWPR